MSDLDWTIHASYWIVSAQLALLLWGRCSRYRELSRAHYDLLSECKRRAQAEAEKDYEMFCYIHQTQERFMGGHCPTCSDTGDVATDRGVRVCPICFPDSIKPESVGEST